MEIATQKFPRKAARLLLTSGFPSPHFPLGKQQWQTLTERKLSGHQSDPQAVAVTEGGGEPLCTSLLLKHAKKQQQFWLRDIYWTWKWGKFLQRPALRPFVASSFYSFSGVCIRTVLPFAPRVLDREDHEQQLSNNVASRLHAKYHLQKMLEI